MEELENSIIILLEKTKNQKIIDLIKKNLFNKNPIDKKYYSKLSSILIKKIKKWNKMLVSSPTFILTTDSSSVDSLNFTNDNGILSNLNIYDNYQSMPKTKDKCVLIEWILNLIHLTFSINNNGYWNINNDFFIFENYNLRDDVNKGKNLRFEIPKIPFLISKILFIDESTNAKISMLQFLDKHLSIIGNILKINPTYSNLIRIYEDCHPHVIVKELIPHENDAIELQMNYENQILNHLIKHPNAFSYETREVIQERPVEYLKERPVEYLEEKMLEQFGGDNTFIKKYLKYKTKYLKLKSKIY